ncbi:hypothetical protein [Paraburkholderia sp. J76]|uniref:hypothetical protein n=1 Tax=Paraburkholderia sp. J76 TaxID=2805439 RepID=UPI002ABDBB95|nr:hypothetical protein [Paraburkholderia sp. J76]
MIDHLLSQLAGSPAALLSFLTAVAGVVGAIVAAIVTALLSKFLVTPWLSARDRQDREVEWRKHAAELTKLDLERKLKSARDLKTTPLRPSIMDFLANYRDLQELGARSPTDLYNDIESRRITRVPLTPATSSTQAKKAPFQLGLVGVGLVLVAVMLAKRR